MTLYTAATSALWIEFDCTFEKYDVKISERVFVLSFSVLGVADNNNVLALGQLHLSPECTGVVEARMGPLDVNSKNMSPQVGFLAVSFAKRY